MKNLLNLHGIVTVLNTPFTCNNHLDVKSLKLNVKNAVKSGVAGFLAPAMASEVDRLTLNERKIMIDAVLEASEGKVPVIGGASATTDKERFTITQDLIDAGCAGILVNIPYQQGKEENLRQSIQRLDELNPPFLMIQDCCFTGGGMPVQFILELYEEIESFKAIKIEVVPAGVKYSRIIKETNNTLHVSGGWAVMQMIEALDRGVHAFMPTAMHQIYTCIYDLYFKNRAKAVGLFNQLLPVLAFSNQHLDISIRFFKRLLYKQKVFQTDKVREPIMVFDKIHEKIADEMIERVDFIMNQLDNFR